MTKINSKIKGKVGELQFSHFLKAKGIDAYRSCQYMGRSDSADIKSDVPIHWECKRVEHLNIHKAMDQAVKDNGDSANVPVVAHRKNRTDWLITFRAKDLEAFLKAFEKKVG